jgi:hypothetical protein
MNDHLDSGEEPSATEMAAIEALLARPEVWDDPPADLEDRVAAAIAAEAISVTGSVAPSSIAEQRATRRSGGFPWWLSAAAAGVLVIAGVALVTRGDDAQSADTEIVLTGTDTTPEASARAALSATPAGLKIVLDVDGLAPAPEGHFYEAWVSNGTLRVSAGTFHLRGGDKPIELWAGVVDPSFTSLAITLEPLDGNTDSSGDAQLVGTYDLDGD